MTNGWTNTMTRKRKRTRGRPLNAKQRTQVRRIVKSNIETKHQIYNFGATSVTTAPEYISVYRNMFSSQGTGQSSFIGNIVRLQSLRVKGLLTQADRTNLMRVILFRPTAKYEPAAGDTEIFNNAAQVLLSSLDRTFVRRVYMDRLYTLNAPDGDTDQQKVIGRTFNLRNAKLDLTALSDPNYQLCWCFVSDSGLPGNPTVEMTHELRLKDA